MPDAQTPAQPPLRIGARPGARRPLAVPWLVIVLCWPATLLGWYYLTLVADPSQWRDRFLLDYLVVLLAVDSTLCVALFLRATPSLRAVLRAAEPPGPEILERAWIEGIDLPVHMGLVICALVALTVVPAAVYLWWWRGLRALVLHGLVAAAIAGACELTVLFPLVQAAALPFLRHLREVRPSLRLDAPGAVAPPLRAYFVFALGTLASVSLILVAALIHGKGEACLGSAVPEGPALALATTCLSAMAAGPAFQVWQAVLLPTRRLAEAMVRVAGEGGDRGAKERIGLLSVGDVGRLCERFDDMLDALARSRMQLEEHEALLRHAQRFEVMGMMAGTFAHEVANPLTSLVSNVAAASDVVAQLESEGRPPAVDALRDVSEALADAARAAGQMTFLVRDMRSFGRKGDKRVANVALADLLDGAIRLAGGEIAKVGGVVRSYQPCGRIAGSPQKLTQVFLNLLLNAVQALPADGRGRIRVSVRQVGAWAEATVEDNGAGMPPEVQARVFEPLFTTKPEGVGTGLGLHLSRRIVEEHGGRIAFESRPSEGTTFRILLPVAASRRAA